MRSLSFAEWSQLPRSISALRAAHPLALQAFPAADPARCLLSGHYATPSAIERRGLFTVPAVLLETLPIISKNYIGQGKATEPRVWATPSKPALRNLGETGKSNIQAVQLAAALYRVLSALDGVEMELDPRVGIALPFTVDPDMFEPERCWISRAASGGGHTSPIMRLDGKTLTVAEALLNLMWPTLAVTKWGLRRRCGKDRCVNPWHYLPPAWNKNLIELLPYAIAVPLRKSFPSIPLPAWNPVDDIVSFTGNWAKWEASCVAALHNTNPQTQAALPDEPEPTSLSDIAPEDAIAAMRAALAGPTGA
jgi:hypothetical protein